MLLFVRQMRLLLLLLLLLFNNFSKNVFKKCRRRRHEPNNLPSPSTGLALVAGKRRMWKLNDKILFARDHFRLFYTFQTILQNKKLQF